MTENKMKEKNSEFCVIFTLALIPHLHPRPPALPLPTHPPSFLPPHLPILHSLSSCLLLLLVATAAVIQVGISPSFSCLFRYCRPDNTLFFPFSCPQLESGGGRSRSPSPSAHDTLTLRALVSSKDAGVIIGKGGKNVADLREQTGVKAGVSKIVPGAHERVLTVSGDVESVAKVCLFRKYLAYFAVK